MSCFVYIEKISQARVPPSEIYTKSRSIYRQVKTKSQDKNHSGKLRNTG